MSLLTELPWMGNKPDRIFYLIWCLNDAGPVPILAVSYLKRVLKGEPQWDNPEFDFWATAETNRSLRSFLSRGSHGDEEEVDDDHHYKKLEAELCFPLQKHQPRSSLSNLQAIAEGRKQLMELAGDMPDSNLELSLKDIVNEWNVSPSRAITEGDHVGVVKGGSFHFATEKQSSRRNNSMQQQKKNAAIKPFVVPRSYSVDKGTFLIKMFGPSTRSSWKTNVKSSSSLKEGCAVRSSSNRCGSSRTTSRSSSCSSSGFSSSSTTRLRRQSSVTTTSTSFLDCLTCLPSFCARGTHKSKQRSRECMF
ncbi:unnamed protein product [Linum trigynum]|uniref:Uncharacterized protein n=1 Tax=Linum trigynum TaxID=586398 RepID=A0AAV2GDZ8_9ROSI